MKYLKLFENWLNEAEMGGGKLFTEYTIGDLRGASDKSAFLREFFKQFIIINKPNYIEGETPTTYEFKKFEVVEKEGVEVQWFPLPFLGKGRKKEGENKKILEEELNILTKDMEEEKGRKLRNYFWEGWFTKSTKMTIEDFEKDGLGYTKKQLDKISGMVENSELKEKGSKIVEILKETIDYCTKELERYKKKFPGGKKITINIEFTPLSVGVIYTFEIQRGLSDKELNPDGKKLIDFKWQSLKDNTSEERNWIYNYNDELELTFGHIGNWLSNTVTPSNSKLGIRGNDLGLLKAPISDVKNNIAKIEPQVKKELIASAKKRK